MASVRELYWSLEAGVEDGWSAARVRLSLALWLLVEAWRAFWSRGDFIARLREWRAVVSGEVQVD